MADSKSKSRPGTGITEQEALDFHRNGRPGKLEINPTKPMATQRDLSLAYSPGVAVPVKAIAADPATAYDYTSRGNMVAVISNGTAILGLGNLGALASKPVMEGKSVLFKRFADVDSIDLEIDTENVDEFINCVRYLGPSFGGINLEDIKAPDCFIIEQRLRELMDIPVFHDDQHGTAIIAAAGLINALELTGRDLQTTKLVCNGAGAAAIACIELIKSMGFNPENIVLCDTKGVIYQGRSEGMNQWKSAHAVKTDKRMLAEAMKGADVVLGLSQKGAFSEDMIRSMADKPIIFAMANPDPEITPEEVACIRDDAIMATGRSDYPNQVNNALCFPYIFRGALDSGATTITREMEIAAVHAIAELAQAEQSDIVAATYGVTNLSFGPEYIIPKPFDPRLMIKIATAVARAAETSGVAARPIPDMNAYAEKLEQFVYHSGTFMRPIFQAAKKAPEAKKRIVFAEGEEERILRAVQVIVDECLAKPILVGRPEVLEQRIKKFGLRLRPDVDFEVINPNFDSRYRDYWQTFLEMTKRRGVTEQYAKLEMRRRHTLIGSMAIHKGDADGMICGTYGTTQLHLHYIDQVLGKREGVNVYAAMNGVILPSRQLVLVDTHVNENPTAEELAEITIMAAEEMRRFGLHPRAALLSHSNFGSSNSESAIKMRKALKLIQEQAPELEADGEMHGDTALDPKLLAQVMPDSPLKGDANLLVMPNIDAANIAYNLLKTASGNGVAIGPILLGCSKPVHILTASATVRRIVNMTALCVMDAMSAR